MLTLPRKIAVNLLSDSAKRCRHLQKHIRCVSSSGHIPDLNFIKKSISIDNGIPLGVMGQPTCHTHPHIVGPGELVAGLTVEEFKSRRAELMKRLVQSASKDRSEKGHTVLIPSASKLYMSDKIPFIFRQSSDFFYLTGCLEPDCLLMMTSLPESDSIHQSILFVRGRDEHSELWDGPRTGLDEATRMFKVDVALPYSELASFLTSHLSSHNSDVLWYSPSSPIHAESDVSVRTALSALKGVTLHCPRKILAGQRLIKSSAEAKLMARACEVGSQAINNAIASTKPGISEHDIHSSIDYWCRRSGAEHLAFPPVVGGGQRATAIHYIHDNQMLADGELLLVDAGCQHSGYNSDITRTWPVSGKFTDPQAVLYDIVYTVQSILIKSLSEGKPTLDDLFDIMCTALGRFLRSEGIIDKSKSDHEIVGLAYKFCPHHVSHYLGIDVHDTPPIPRNIPIKPGMVMTVEPGIYIGSNDTSVPKEFRGIGIRIEDDVLITHREPVILTQSCIKSRKSIEKLVGTRSLPK